MRSHMLMLLILFESCRNLKAKCPLNPIREGIKAQNYFQTGDFLIGGIISPNMFGLQLPYIFSQPPLSRFKQESH
ncbi:Hypothetical predicted protein [Podarcis lilfordi]|uniref:Uncharacterized protein n=1 Tax=Podarcis lilfordi TaxID=74358 RepID=A0AA35P1U7_9SAUR|nr:Hypothetical predicted protein [Podarcis lilfordi]